jgi:hypothetical protein
MTAEAWATIITSVVVPLLVKVLLHYFPWLADADLPGPRHATPPTQETGETDE